MKRIALSVAVLAASVAQAQVPAGWQTIKDDTGPCRMSVPAQWKQQDIMGQKIAAAKAPDSSIDAVVNTMKDAPWSGFKSFVHMVYAKEKDGAKIEDSANRYWFEIVSMPVKGKTAWYVAVPAGKTTCNAQVNFRKGDKKAEETARAIAMSIRAS